MHDNRPLIIQGEENYRKFLEAGKEHNLTKALERFNKHHKKKEKNMERLTYRDELGRSIDKNEDCPTCSICWNCDIPPRKCNYLNDALEKLAEYEDAEEQGLLLRLPCKVGDTVYVIGSLSEFGVTEEIELKVFECMVNKITLNYKYGNTMQMDCKEHVSFGWSMNMKKINELVFLTKEEAEQALKQMGE